ncbi:hypothetical protein ACFUO0_19980 [Streptomyces cinereoruber]|uniref:hypothetical protein n=1 Tax=Streptomyces cinereoruber TaxID=67260 RepID=UPI0036310D49
MTVLFSVAGVVGVQATAHADPGWGRSAPVVVPAPTATPAPLDPAYDPGWG